MRITVVHGGKDVVSRNDGLQMLSRAVGLTVRPQPNASIAAQGGMIHARVCSVSREIFSRIARVVEGHFSESTKRDPTSQSSVLR